MQIKSKLHEPYRFLLFLYAIFIVFAFVVQSPKDILNGLVTIVLAPDILITDYVEIAGIGATLVNSALVGIICVFIMAASGVNPNGFTIMGFWLTTGFAFFGKNIYNIWPIMFGVWLFSKYQKEPFLNFSLAALLALSMSPAVSQLQSLNIFPPVVAVLLGIGIGIGIGFVFPAISAASLKVHGGYNLYNGGFAAGIIGMFVMSFFRCMGIDFPTVRYWNVGSNVTLGIFMCLVCLVLIIKGVISGKDNIQHLKQIHTHSGRLVTDYFMPYGDSVYISMGITGLFSTCLVLVLGGDLNGPTLGGIFTIVGFSCAGKHMKNIVPIMAGALLSTYVNKWDVTSPSNMLGILFSTALAPIAGDFGPVAGVIAGFVHIYIVSNTGSLHGGMNLYNNGFAAGLVAFALVPLLTTFRKDTNNEE